MVIDVPKETYEALMINQYCGSKSELENIIVNGTPLPAEYGRLIDISEYEKYFNTAITYDDGNHKHVVYTNTIPTIIEGSDSE